VHDGRRFQDWKRFIVNTFAFRNRLSEGIHLHEVIDALNAAILAAQMIALSDKDLAAKLATYKENLKSKIVKANEDLAAVKYNFKVN
jgi:hypothetical protein